MKSEQVQSVDESLVFEITKKFIESESVNPPGLEREAAAVAADYMSQIGMEVRTEEIEPGRPNVIGTLSGDGEGPTLMFNGHLDVVPAGDLNQWRSPPFKPRTESGRIYGRGSCDMKGGLAAILGAIKAVSDSKSKWRGKIIVAMVMDEESGGKGTHEVVKRGYKADMAVIAEPTRLEVLTAHKGVVTFEIATYGKSIHASTVKSKGSEGVNAIYKMTKVITALEKHLEELEMKKHPLVGNPTVNVGTITGGTKQNVVPDFCKIVLERRLIPGEKEVDGAREIRGIIEKIAKTDPAFKYDMNIVMSREPTEVSPEEKIVKLSRMAVKSVTGTDPGYAGFVASTDMSILVNQGKIPTVMLGPGDVAQAHTPNEYIEQSQIVAATRIYANLIVSALA